MSIDLKYWIATSWAAKVLGSRVLLAVGTKSVTCVCVGAGILVTMVSGVSEGAWELVVAVAVQAARSDDNANNMIVIIFIFLTSHFFAYNVDEPHDCIVSPSY
jgi:hypothetical protein